MSLYAEICIFDVKTYFLYILMSTAQDLYKACMRDNWPALSTMVDYFGNSLGDDAKENVVLGVYQGLIRWMGC